MMMIFLFEFRNCSKSLPLLWMQEKLLQVWLSLLRCDWHIWWGYTCSTVHIWRSVGSTSESSASPLPPSLGFQVRLRPRGSDNTRFHLELSRWPSPTFLLETGFLSEPGVVCLGNAGEPVLGCAWQCWSYSMLFSGCWGSRLRLSCLHGERFTSEPCCQPLLHFILIWISCFIRKGGASICVCLLNCSEIYFMAECLVCFRGVSVTPGNLWKVFCLVGFSGIGLWFYASLPGPACLL